MNKKAWLVTLASLGAGAVLAQNSNTVPAVQPPTNSAVPALAAPAPAVPAAPAPAAPVPAIAAPAPTPDVPAVNPSAPTEAKPEAEAKPKAKKKTAAKKPAAKVISSGLPAAHTLLDPAVPATVKVENLNVRGLPSLSGEVITKLHKGETVTMLEEITLDKIRQGEPAKWARVTLPTNTPAWISSHLIDPATKTVKVKKLNVRGGPGENFNIIGHLDKGAVVKETGKKNEWVEIEAPANLSAFVSADYLEKQAGSTTAPVAPAPVTSETAPVAAAPALPAPTTEVVTVAPDTNSVVMPAMDATPAPAAPAPAPAAPATTVEATPAAPAAVAAPEVAPAPEAQAETPVLPKRIVTREGVVRIAKNIQAPTYYELRDAASNELIDYLHPSKQEADLKPYIGKKVFVSGEEAMDRRWRFTPVIEVESVELP